MSRIGKQPVVIPEGTQVTVSGDEIAVKGKGGELRRKLHPSVSVKVTDSEVTVSPSNESREAQSLWGTFASLIQNMVQGVNEPFVKKLVVEGIGFKSNVEGKTLVLDVGFSHSVRVDIPEDLQVNAEKNEITIRGINKERVGQFAADVRKVKKPEPYKGKGIRYHDEVVRRKEGKRVVA